MREWGELERLLYRWGHIARMVSWERTRKFDSETECLRIVERLQEQNHDYTVWNDHIMDHGWSVTDWGDRLAEAFPELVDWEGEWYDLQEGAQKDVYVSEIVQKCYEHFPHVDTTPFVEFGHAVRMLWDDDIDFSYYRDSSGPDDSDFLESYASYREAKTLLGISYERASRVGERIEILEWGNAGPSVRVVSTRVSVNLADYTVMILPKRDVDAVQQFGPLEPHEAQYINALVEAKMGGSGYVTENDLKQLPLAEGRNITRDFNGSEGKRPVRGIKQKYPKLWNIIGANRNGRYLKV